MMLYPRLATALLSGLLLLSITACSDPASVGTDIGRDSLSGGNPTTTEIVVTSTQQQTTPSVTGYTSDTRPWRFLTGRVEDNLAGTIETDGYLSFAGTTRPRDTIATAAASDLRATLHLDREYVHGDTSASSDLTVELYDLSSAADMGGASADTEFNAESAPIATYTASPTASTVAFDLPQSWVDEHAAALQDTTADSFEDDGFFGFKLATTTGNEAVVGFDHDAARLTVSTPADTVNYEPSQSFTHVEHDSSSSPTLPSDEDLLIDGVGQRLAFDWDGSPTLDSLINANALLNRAAITVPVDTSIYDPPATPAGFVRPEPSGYRLLATRRTNGPRCGDLGLFVAENRDDTCVIPSDPSWAPGAARSTDNAGFNIFDRWFFEERPFDDFTVEVAPRNSTLSGTESTQRGLPSTIPAVVRVPDAGSTADRDEPRVVVTVTPL